MNSLKSYITILSKRTCDCSIPQTIPLYSFPHNNPDTDPYQDTSQFSSLDTQSTPASPLTQTSTKEKNVSNDFTPTPKYQNLSYSSSLHDNLDNTLDSTDSDFDMRPNSM